MKVFTVACTAAAVAFASPSLAANLIVNGSFEDGLNSWTVTHDTGTAPVALYYGDSGGYPNGAHGEAVLPNLLASASPDPVGKRALYFSSDTTNTDALSQSINVIAGQSYAYGFDYYFPANGQANPFDAYASVTLGNTVLASGVIKTLAAQNWFQISGTYLATSSGPITFKIAFDGFGVNGNDYAADMVFDRVYVNTAAVPEPATWAMMIGGFALIGASMRRRKAAVSFA
jgi:hypothetical protein